jgi:hypothetical protein
MFAGGADLDALHVTVVVRHQPGRRLAHHLEQVIVDTRLVDDHVRHLGQAILGILDPAAAGDPRPVIRIGFPEHRLVDPIRFPQQAIGEAERLEHLDRPAGDAVGLAELERPRLPLDDPRPDFRKCSELGGEDEPRGTAADDEDVDLAGDAFRCLHRIRRCRQHPRIAEAVSIEIELHQPSRSVVSAGNAARRFPVHPMNAPCARRRCCSVAAGTSCGDAPP